MSSACAVGGPVGRGGGVMQETEGLDGGSWNSHHSVPVLVNPIYKLHHYCLLTQKKIDPSMELRMDRSRSKDNTYILYVI